MSRSFRTNESKSEPKDTDSKTCQSVSREVQGWQQQPGKTTVADDSNYYTPEWNEWLQEARRQNAKRIKSNNNTFFGVVNAGIGAAATKKWGGQFELPNTQEMSRLPQKLTETDWLGRCRLVAEGDSLRLTSEQKDIRQAIITRGQFKQFTGMIGAWAGNFVADKVLFPRDQSLEATLAADWLAGPAIACARGPLWAKLVGIVGTHIAGKYIDSKRQPYLQ